MKKQNLLRRFSIAVLVLALLLTAACANQPTLSSEDPSATVSDEPSSSSVESTESEVSESSAASESSVSEAPPAKEVSAPRTVLTLNEPPQTDTLKSVEELHSLNVTGYTYHEITTATDQTALCKQLDALVLDESAVVDLKQPSIAGFLTIRDGVKTSYMVTDTQVYSTNNDVNKVYKSDVKLRASLQTLSDCYNKSYSGTPQWLAYMSTGRITKAEFVGLSKDLKKDAGFTTTDAAELRQISHLLKNLKVDPAGSDMPSSLNPCTSSARISLTLTFDSGVEYYLNSANYVDYSGFSLASSDQSKDISYTLEPPEQLEKLLALAEEFSGCTPSRENPDTAKPVIYLYPEKTTDVSVKLDFAGDLTYTYPVYNNGWQVTAYPDGRLVNKPDATEHFYLFWEGNSDTKWRFDEGFCVPGSQIETFLREMLAFMGLTPREYNDFLVYWVPELKQNKYNLITFATDQYEQLAPLTVSPAPDSVLRVHMVYRAVAAPVTIAPQTFEPFVRKGFTMVEWGGSRA